MMADSTRSCRTEYGSEILASINPLAVDSSRRLDFSCVGPKAPLNGALREVPRNEAHRVRRRTKPVLELLDIRHNKAPCTGSGMVSTPPLEKNGDSLSPVSMAVPKEVLRMQTISRELEDISAIELEEVLTVRRKTRELESGAQSANGHTEMPARAGSGKVFSPSPTKLQNNGELQRMPRSASPAVKPKPAPRPSSPSRVLKVLNRKP